MKRSFALLVCASLLLNSCGESRIERAGSGAAIAGGIGLASGFLCCKSAGDGAEKGFFIGVGLGALIGFILDEPLFFNYHRN